MRGNICDQSTEAPSIADTQIGNLRFKISKERMFYPVRIARAGNAEAAEGVVLCESPGASGLRTLNVMTRNSSIISGLY